MAKLKSATRLYLEARQWLSSSSYVGEIEWQRSRHPDSLSETEFLSQAAWVVYNSGFRESVIRRHFDYLSLCFCDWNSAEEIVSAGPVCIDSAMLALGNRKKHEAVFRIAQCVQVAGFRSFWDSALEDPIENLQKLPYIGPITAVHLAKNLGFDVAKPDRHLVRLQRELGFADVSSMCSHLSSATGDPVRVVDLILWRFMERGANIKVRRTPQKSLPLTEPDSVAFSLA